MSTLSFTTEEDGLMQWQDLSDGELVSRLVNRGMPPAEAESWVHYRESVGGAEQIDRILGDDT